MEKINEGYRGVLLSLKKDDVTPYSVTLDAQGKEIKREKLRTAGGINYRMAPPPDTSRREEVEILILPVIHQLLQICL